MIKTIAKREFLDHLLSLRFGLMVILVLVVMIVCGVIFPNEYRKMIDMKINDEKFNMEVLRMWSDSLAKVGARGPLYLVKQPSILGFISSGGEKNLPRYIMGSSPGWGATTIPWVLQYHSYDIALYRKSRLIPFEFDLDWGFIIGFIMSIAGITLIFDSISGEKEKGTLKLMLANSISRNSILLGKYLGALVSLGLPLLLGMLICFLIIMIRLSMGREAIFIIVPVFLVSLIYLSIFLFLGITISSYASSSISLLISLFIWICFIIFIPNAVAILSKKINPIEPESTFHTQKQLRLKEIENKYWRKGIIKIPPSKNPSSRELIEGWGRYLKEYQEVLERFTDERLDRMLRQVEVAQKLGMISPYQTFLYLLQAMAGTGIAHHKAFVKNARRYREEFRKFIAEKDAKDPESLHVLYVEEGISKRPIFLEEIPKFKDEYKVSEWIQYGITPMAILLILAVFMFFLSNLGFMKADVG